jgi:hypothetical protein
LGSLTIGGSDTAGVQTETLTISAQILNSRAPGDGKAGGYQSTLGNKDWVGEANRMRETIVAEPTVEHRIVAHGGGDWCNVGGM